MFLRLIFDPDLKFLRDFLRDIFFGFLMSVFLGFGVGSFFPFGLCWRMPSPSWFIRFLE